MTTLQRTLCTERVTLVHGGGIAEFRHHNSGMSSSNTTSDDDESSDEDDEDDFIQDFDIGVLAEAVLVIKQKPLQKAYRGVKTKRRSPAEIRELEQDMEEYLRNLFSFPHCFSRYQNRFVSCACLSNEQENCSYALLASRLGNFCFCFCYCFFLLLQHLINNLFSFFCGLST